MRMRAADDTNDSSNHTASPAYHINQSSSPPRQNLPLHREGNSPVLTELLPSRPHLSGQLQPGEGHHQNITLFVLSPTGTAQGYDGSERYSSHPLSYYGDSHHLYQHYSPAPDAYGRSVSDSESGYHTPESSPYNAHGNHSSPTVSAAVATSESAMTWSSPAAASYASKEEFVSQEPASRSQTTHYLAETPCYFPSTHAEHNSQTMHERRDRGEDSMSPGHIKNANEVYGEEDRQQILDNLLARKPGRLSETENVSPVPPQSGAKKSSGYKKRRRRTQTLLQRTAANMRERKRMCHLNSAFDILKDHLPNVRNTKKMSRIQTLRAAIYYIGLLADCLHMA